MTSREELIKTVAEAAQFDGTPLDSRIAANVVDAIEPTIRADERSRQSDRLAGLEVADYEASIRSSALLEAANALNPDIHLPDMDFQSEFRQGLRAGWWSAVNYLTNAAKGRR